MSLMWNKFKEVLVVTVLSATALSCIGQSDNSRVIKREKMKVIYIMDPQCGWCYGNSSNIKSLYQEYGDKLEFELLVGGMWLGPNAPKGGEGLSGFLQTHAPRMSQTTGAQVGQAYYDLAKDPSYTFSSLEPSAAIVAVRQIAPDKLFEFVGLVQKALILDGKRLDKQETYQQIVEQLSIDYSTFQKVWMTESNVQETIQEFKRAGSMASGFPTLLVETAVGTHPLAAGYFDLNQMKSKLDSL
ncbi:DsbA family protein [Reichenbachiella versicolor]|uniref:DsbA family protein n=1 Tax=Reichenbachiella versicolor TaxID=1821036 RepID=UPI000D6DEDEE|nr:DsbA family protein [Reichenbachiella versicolor]